MKKAILTNSFTVTEWFGNDYEYDESDLITFEEGIELEVLKHVNSSGFGELYVVYDKENNESFVVNGLHLEFISDDSFTNTMQNQVEEFHLAFNHPVSTEPTLMSLERAVNRQIWTGEELIEYLQASSNDKEEFAKSYYSLLEGLNKAYLKSLNGEFSNNYNDKLVGQADALTDALYFMFGTAVELGVDIQKVFDIVQSANMSKLFTAEDGTKYAKYREEDGKILKSPDFFSPEKFIEEEIMNQFK